MKTDTIKNGIIGALIGISAVTGAGYNPADIDPRTGKTFEYILNSETGKEDIYYVVELEKIPENYWSFLHEKPDTLRECNGKAIIKADLNKIPMDVDVVFLGNPYTQELIAEWVKLNCDNID